MNVRVKYGRDGLNVVIPDEVDAHVLSLNRVEPIHDAIGAVRHAIESPIGAAPLREIARGRRDAAITISDITRPVPNTIILPPILDALNDAGISDDRVVIVVGTGLHRANTPDELRNMVGKEVMRRVRIVNHVARDESTLTYVGETSHGTPVWINRVFVEADLHIATSLIEPHLMAGFSGGRKAICPGMAGVKTMRIMHGPTMLGHERVCEGRLDGNPFHIEATEIARMVGVDFIVNVSLDDARHITGVFAGDLEGAHAHGCAFVAHQSSAKLHRPADIVITSSAGYPLDLTFYQSIKAMTAALPAVKQGGTIIVASSCDEGIGSPEFTALMRETASVAEFREQLADPDFFVIDQWQLQEMCKALDRAEIMYFTEGLDVGTLRDLLVTPVTSVEYALDTALQRHGRNALVAVIPDGPYVLAGVE